MKHASGLTLIEVMIALAIISIALTSIIKAASQNIRSTTYLEDKTIAMWVGAEVINEARVGVLTFSDPGNTLKQTSHMLGRDWYWQAIEEETPNKHIKKIEVSVFANKNDEANEAQSLVTLASYVYHEQ